MYVSNVVVKTVVQFSLLLSTTNGLIRVPGVIRSARSGRLLRRRRRRRSETVVCSTRRRQPKQTGSDRPAGRVALRGSPVRRRPVRRSPVRRLPVRGRLPVRRRRPVRSSFPVRHPVRLFVHHLPVRSQDLGFAVHILPVNRPTPSRNTTDQDALVESLLN